jgi:hypothetical protein
VFATAAPILPVRRDDERSCLILMGAGDMRRRRNATGSGPVAETWEGEAKSQETLSTVFFDAASCWRTVEPEVLGAGIFWSPYAPLGDRDGLFR